MIPPTPDDLEAAASVANEAYRELWRADGVERFLRRALRDAEIAGIDAQHAEHDARLDVLLLEARAYLCKHPEVEALIRDREAHKLALRRRKLLDASKWTELGYGCAVVLGVEPLRYRGRKP